MPRTGGPPSPLPPLALPLPPTPAPMPHASTSTSALGGVYPALAPHGSRVSAVRLSLTSPKRGTPWAPKALFGSGRQAQSPKPLPRLTLNHTANPPPIGSVLAPSPFQPGGCLLRPCTAFRVIWYAAAFVSRDDSPQFCRMERVLGRWHPPLLWPPDLLLRRTLFCAVPLHVSKLTAGSGDSEFCTITF